jgi:hypothetical protein
LTTTSRWPKSGVGATALRHRESVNARRLIAALAVFAVVAAGLGITIAVLTAKPQPPVAAAPPPPPPRPQVPTPAEFQLGVVVTDQNCSGPAGCVYKYRVEPKYRGLHPLPDKEFTVMYRVTGGRQPQTGDFTLRGDQATVLQDVPLEGPPGARLQASVTRVVG